MATRICKGAVGIALRRRNRLHDGIEQRFQILSTALNIRGGRPGLGVRVKDRELQLIFLGVEVDEQIVNFVEHFLRPGIGAVDLVDDNNGRQLGLQGFSEYVASLRQRAFAGIHQQHDAVDHLERAFDFAAKVAVARRVDNIDLDARVKDRGVLGENCDAALALQFVRVHDAVDVSFVRTKSAALLQQGIDQRGLAVVDVRDDSDIANA